jgi:hypothetical protein
VFGQVVLLPAANLGLWTPLALPNTGRGHNLRHFVLSEAALAVADRVSRQVARPSGIGSRHSADGGITWAVSELTSGS